MRCVLLLAMTLLSGNAATAQTAPNTTATGETMPPSREASATSRRSPDRHTEDEREMERVETSICIGCGAKESRDERRDIP